MDSLIEEKKKEEKKEGGKEGGREEGTEERKKRKELAGMEHCKREITDERPPVLFGGRDHNLPSTEDSAWCMVGGEGVVGGGRKRNVGGRGGGETERERERERSVGREKR